MFADPLRHRNSTAAPADESGRPMKFLNADSSYCTGRHVGANWVRALSQVRTQASASAALVACLLGAFATPALAEQADRSKPLVYSADHLSYDDLKQTTILTGNVELTKGTIIVRGDRAEIHQDPEGYSYATATSDKGLSYIREKRDGVNEYFEGNGKRIDYDGKNDVSTLTGQAVARRLQGLTTPIDEVHGSVIRYDGQTGFYTATSNGGTKTNSSGRVRGMIAPTTTSPPDSAASGSGDDGAGVKGSLPSPPLAPAQHLEDSE